MPGQPRESDERRRGGAEDDAQPRPRDGERAGQRDHGQDDGGEGRRQVAKRPVPGEERSADDQRRDDHLLDEERKLRGAQRDDGTAEHDRAEKVRAGAEPQHAAEQQSDDHEQRDCAASHAPSAVKSTTGQGRSSGCGTVVVAGSQPCATAERTASSSRRSSVMASLRGGLVYLLFNRASRHGELGALLLVGLAAAGLLAGTVSLLLRLARRHGAMP